MNVKPVLVIVAVDEELDVTLPFPYKKIVVGVGKINATIGTLRAILKHMPDLVINFGTAGSLNPAYSKGLYKIGSVVQRDFDARPLVKKLGQVPYDTTPECIKLGTGLVLSTGDNFVTSKPEMESDLVDMEGFAIAKVCLELGVDLSMYKYVTDSADEEAGDSWLSQMRDGAEEFLKLL